MQHQCTAIVEFPVTRQHDPSVEIGVAATNRIASPTLMPVKDLRAAARKEPPKHRAGAAAARVTA